MAKKVLTTIKLQAAGGQASPAPPVGPALGQHGINIMEFCKAFNAQTQQDPGTTIPVVITVYEDRSFTFITKTPPAAVLIKQAINLAKGSGEPHKDKVGKISQSQLRAIAEKKLPDLNANDVDARDEDHRRHRPLDGRGGGWLMAKHGKKYLEARAARRSRARVRRPPRRSSWSRRSSRRASTSPSRSTSAPASTSATPTSSCAAPSRCPTGSARASRSPSSPRATRRARPRRPARTSSAPRTSPRRSRRASPTSTSPSRRRT